jgi:hypothetical protein
MGAAASPSPTGSSRPRSQNRHHLAKRPRKIPGFGPRMSRRMHRGALATLKQLVHPYLHSTYFSPACAIHIPVVQGCVQQGPSRRVDSHRRLGRPIKPERERASGPSCDLIRASSCVGQPPPLRKDGERGPSGMFSADYLVDRCHFNGSPSPSTPRTHTHTSQILRRRKTRVCYTCSVDTPTSATISGGGGKIEGDLLATM